MSSRRRSVAPPELKRRQDQALGGVMRIVRELGPTAFVLQEDGAEPRPPELRVSLGNPHLCSCSVFMKEKDLCKHICWLLLKKFKLPRDHEYALQFGLVEREINYVLQGPQVASQPRVTTNSAKELQPANDGYIKQKDIDNEDICPICQEVLLKKMLPVTYCRLSCGNNIHVVCMKIWADHQKELERDSLVKCPLCREVFAPLKLILEEFRNCKRLFTAAEKQHLDKHLGIPCNNCKVCPIEGNCYKCTKCSEYHLCHECFRSFCHPSHNFVFREKRNQRWRSAEQVVQLSTSGGNLKSTNPEWHFKEEKNKEKFTCIPEHIICSLPTVLIRKSSSLLDPGLQCRICLKSFHLGQVIRFLPCNHKFHRKCIDCWLHKENTCPIDGHVVYNPLTWDEIPSKCKVNPLVSQAKNRLPKQTEQELFIPGTGLIVKPLQPGQVLEKSQSTTSLKINTKKSPSAFQQNFTLNGFSCTSMRETDSSQHTAPKIRHLKFSRYVKGLALIPKAHSVVFTEGTVVTGLRGLSVNGNAN